MECIAAAYAEDKGFRSKVIDSIADNTSKAETLKMIKDLKPRLVTVATSTPSIYSDIEIANKIKEVLPDSIVALVGRHASWAPQETLKKSKADCVLINEYYFQAVDILKNLKFDKIKGIAYRKAGKIKINREGKLIEPNDIPLISPIIKRDLKVENYFYASLKNPYIMLQNSWGCAFNCDFCLVGDTEIVVSKDKKTIKTIKIERLYDNKIKSVLGKRSQNIVKTRIKKYFKRETNEVIKIKIGEKVLKITPNHKIFTKRGWIEAKDLTIKDEVLVL